MNAGLAVARIGGASARRLGDLRVSRRPVEDPPRLARHRDDQLTAVRRPASPRRLLARDRRRCDRCRSILSAGGFGLPANEPIEMGADQGDAGVCPAGQLPWSRGRRCAPSASWNGCGQRRETRRRTVPSARCRLPRRSPVIASWRRGSRCHPLSGGVRERRDRSCCRGSPHDAEGSPRQAYDELQTLLLIFLRGPEL